MAKAPFERVFSLIERKRLLQRVAKDENKILIKNSKNEIFELHILDIDSAGNIEGHIKQGSFRDMQTVTALFKVDTDKYFLTTRLKKKNTSWVLLNDTRLYKLNRRSAYRVKIPVSVEISYFVSTIRNIEINRKISLLEFSSTGARVHWFNEKGISKGTVARGYIQWGKGKVLPIDFTVIHSPEAGILGVRFVNMTAVIQNRLKMLSIEIQQTIHFQKGL